MEDHICALLELGYDERLAEERTMAAMGDPAEVGREMDKQYPRYWDRITGVSVIVSIVMIFVMVLGIGSLGFLWDSVAFRFRAPENRSAMDYTAEEERDIRVTVGNDVLRVYRRLPSVPMTGFPAASCPESCWTALRRRASGERPDGTAATAEAAATGWRSIPACGPRSGWETTTSRCGTSGWARPF